MNAASTIPEAGDILWVDFGAPEGHEQAGRRPALVVSGSDYNAGSSLVVVCPISRSDKPWPFKVRIAEGSAIQGWVLVDQVRAIDQRLRVVRAGGRVAPSTLVDVREGIALLIGFQVP